MSCSHRGPHTNHGPTEGMPIRRLGIMSLTSKSLFESVKAHRDD